MYKRKKYLQIHFNNIMYCTTTSPSYRKYKNLSCLSLSELTHIPVFPPNLFFYTFYEYIKLKLG